MSALVKVARSALLALLPFAAVPAASAAIVTVANNTPGQACLALADWEIGLICLPPQAGSALPCTYQPLPQWHGTSWQCLAAGETRGFSFDSSLLVSVTLGSYAGVDGRSDYVAAHPLAGLAPNQTEWVRPGAFETRIAPLNGGAYAATVAVAGGPWQARRAMSLPDLCGQLQQLGFGPVTAWRLDQSFTISLQLP